MNVGSVMTKDVGTCVRDQTLADAARIMLERDCGVIPVLESRASRKLAGVITDRDICIAAYSKGKPLDKISIGEVMAKHVVSCGASDGINTAEQRMQHAQVHRLPVIDEAGELVGVLSLADIARAIARGKQAVITAVEVGETVAAIRRPREIARAT